MASLPGGGGEVRSEQAVNERLLPIQDSEAVPQTRKATYLPIVAVLSLLSAAVLASVYVVNTADSGDKPGRYQPNTVYMVDIQGMALDERLTATVAMGLLNRRFHKPTVVGNITVTDRLWLDTLQSQESPLASLTFKNISGWELAELAVYTGAAVGRIAYDPQEAWSFSTVVTLCGIHRAIPVPMQRHNITTLDSPAAPSMQPYRRLPQLQDVRGRWADDIAATLWAVLNLHGQTNSTNEILVVQHPMLLSLGLLADLVVQRQLFALYMTDLCTAGTTANAIYQLVTTPAHDEGQLLSIMGYFPSEEVVASCSQHHTEISLVSDWCPSLSFYSLMQPTNALSQNPPLAFEPYAPNKTYIAILQSDGDNMQMEFNGNRDRMEERFAACGTPEARAVHACPPISWTFSNRLLTFAPFIVQWWFSRAQATGLDSYLMGPSGYGFLHPSQMAPGDIQTALLVNNTVQAATEMAMEGFVHWDDYGNGLQQAAPHEDAGHGAEVQQLLRSHYGDSSNPLIHQLLATVPATPNRAASSRSQPAQLSSANTLHMAAYLERFNSTAIKSVFSPVQPAVPAWIGDVATFQENFRWWQSTEVEKVAKIMNDQPLGSLSYIYKIIDVEYSHVEAVLGLLGPHVQLVGYRELTALARQKREMGL